jgi:hypothetical protein
VQLIALADLPCRSRRASLADEEANRLAAGKTIPHAEPLATPRLADQKIKSVPSGILFIDAEMRRETATLNAQPAWAIAPAEIAMGPLAIPDHASRLAFLLAGPAHACRRSVPLDRCAQLAVQRIGDLPRRRLVGARSPVAQGPNGALPHSEGIAL